MEFIMLELGPSNDCHGAAVCHLLFKLLIQIACFGCLCYFASLVSFLSLFLIKQDGT